MPMRSYRLNEADVQVPGDWKDNTINAFVLPGEEGGGAASFVITRDAEAGGVELQVYADQQLVKAAQQLPSYALLTRDTTRIIAGQPAIQSDFTWLTPEGVSVRQRQACLRNGDLILVLTLTARDATFSNYEPVWGQVVDTLRLRTDDAG